MGRRITSIDTQHSLVGFLVLAALCLAVGCDDLLGPSEEKIEVLCGLDLQLTKDSGVIQDASGQDVSWSAVRDGDRITLTREIACGPDCKRTNKIVLEGFGSECPTFVSASTTLYDPERYGDVVIGVRAVDGLLLMQDWDATAGIVSGRVEAEVVFVFYAELGQ